MVKLLGLALVLAAASILLSCGDDDKNEMKERCLTCCEVFVVCVPDQPSAAESCRSSCDAFDYPDSAAEYEELFLCKETCVNQAAQDQECICLLEFKDGGPDC